MNTGNHDNLFCIVFYSANIHIQDTAHSKGIGCNYQIRSAQYAAIQTTGIIVRADAGIWPYVLRVAITGIAITRSRARAAANTYIALQGAVTRINVFMQPANV